MPDYDQVGTLILDNVDRQLEIQLPYDLSVLDADVGAYSGVDPIIEFFVPNVGPQYERLRTVQDWYVPPYGGRTVNDSRTFWTIHMPLRLSLFDGGRVIDTRAIWERAQTDDAGVFRPYRITMPGALDDGSDLEVTFPRAYMSQADDADLGAVYAILSDIIGNGGQITFNHVDRGGSRDLATVGFVIERWNTDNADYETLNPTIPGPDQAQVWFGLESEGAQSGVLTVDPEGATASIPMRSLVTRMRYLKRLEDPDTRMIWGQHLDGTPLIWTLESSNRLSRDELSVAWQSLIQTD